MDRPKPTLRAADPDIVLKYCDLALKLDQSDRAQAVLAKATQRLEHWSSPQLLRLMQVAEKNRDFKLAAAAFAEATARDTVSLPLATYAVKLAHTAADANLLVGVRHWLETHLPENEIARFRLQSDLLLDGPDVALARARAARVKMRAPNEAADLVEVLFQAGKRKTVLRYLGFCRRRWPNSFRFLALLTTAYQRFGAPQQALDLLAASADPLSARVLRMRLHILLESNQLEKADALIAQAGDIGAALLNPFQMMRLKLGRGEIDAANALARVVSSGMGRGGGANSKFRATHIGALLNEAQLFLRSNDGLSPDMSPELERVFFHPAKLALDRWQGTVPTGAAPAGAPDIPRRVLQYWDTATIPPEVAAVMQSWQDLPGYTYHRYDKAGAITFLKDRFDAAHVQAFRMANNVAEECDFLRLCLLLADGGIYTDADDMLVGDIDALRVLGRGVVLFREPVIGSIANNLMMARAGHPLLQIAVDMARASLLARENDNTWAKTGPGLISRATAAYIAQTPADEVPQNLCLLPGYVASTQIQAHVRLPYKATPAYWNSNDGATPPELRKVLHAMAATV